MAINPYTPFQTASLFEPPATSLSRLVAGMVQKRDSIFALQSRSGATTYTNGVDIRTAGARFVYLIFDCTVYGGTATMYPLVTPKIGGIYASLPAPTGLAATGTTRCLFGAVPLVTTVGNMSVPCALPDIIRIGYSASDNSANTCQVIYSLCY
jgi:hypothetical protein